MTKFRILRKTNLSLRQSEVYMANLLPLHFVFHPVLRDSDKYVPGCIMETTDCPLGK